MTHQHSDLTAERTVLSGMLRSVDVLTDAANHLGPMDFARPAHQRIYQALLRTYFHSALTQAPDVEAVMALLEKDDLFTDDTCTDRYLNTLLALKPATGTHTEAVERVRSLATLRRLRSAAREIETLTNETDPKAADSLAEKAQAEIYAASTSRRKHHPTRTLSSVLEATLDEVEAAGSHLTGLATGFQDLDSLTGGLHPGHLVLLASRTAMGQTTLALDFLRSAAVKHRAPTVFFTRDASVNALSMRLLAAESSVARHHMRSGQLTDADWTRLATHIPHLTEAPVYLHDDVNATFAQVSAECRRLHAQRDLQLVIIDGIQLIDHGKPLSNRYEEISEVARGLKRLALELHLPVVATSSLNRGPEQRANKRPQLSDLRDSGSLGDLADLVILIHREWAYDKDTSLAGATELIVAKQNEGTTGTINTAIFEGTYGRFEDLARPRPR